MQIMYISRRFEDNICATIHYKAIKEIFGNTDVYTIDLRRNKQYENEYYKTYGNCSRIEKFLRYCQLNISLLSNRIIIDICNRIKKFDIKKVFIDESNFGKLVKKIKQRCPDVQVISFYHDIDYIAHKERLKIIGLKYLPIYITTSHGEKLTQKYSDCNAVLNHRDSKLFQKCYGKSPEIYLPMAVEAPDLNMLIAEEFNFDRTNKEVRYLLFVGAYFYPNINGLQWFVDQVFLKMNENYRLIVIGRGMEKVKDNYKKDPRIYIIGSVNHLSPYYNNADVVVIPIFEGGGMKQKTAEAIAHGRCIVGTTESLFGYEDSIEIRENEKQLVYCCNTAEEQLAAFETIERNEILGYHAKLNNLYVKHYSLNISKEILSKLLLV